MKENYQLVPKLSLGPFKFNDSIRNYFDEFNLYVSDEEEDSTRWTTYKSDEFSYEIYVEEGKIEAISCSEECYIEPILENLIGLDFEVYLRKLAVDFSGKPDRIYVADVDDYQMVYEFPMLGAQVWVYDNRIRTFICSAE